MAGFSVSGQCQTRPAWSAHSGWAHGANVGDACACRPFIRLLLIGASLFVVSAARAQTPPAQAAAESGLFLKQVTTKGLPVGSFNLNSGLTVGESFDDNIYATPNNRVSDFITTILPFIGLRSNWAHNMLNFQASGDFGRYAAHSNENYNDYSVGGDGRYDVTKRVNIFGGASFAHLHESPESPDNVNGTLPTTYNDLQSHLGIEVKQDRFFARFGGTFEQLNYNNVPSAAGYINNNDRDRNVYELGGRVGMELGGGFQVFVQGTHNWRDYRLPVDDYGYARNSSGNEIDVGFAQEGPGPLTGEAYVGYLDQNYVDAALGNVSVPDFGGELTYHISQVTKVTAFLSRAVLESDLQGVGSYLDTTGGFRFDHDLRRDLKWQVRASYSFDDFTGTSRRDRVASFGTGLRYFFMPQLFVGADYQYQRRSSNDVTVNYDDNRFMVRLGVQLARGYATTAAEPPQNRGFYLGTEMNFSDLSSNVVGARGSGGSLDANFGNGGLGGTVLAGYAAIINRWFVGVEVDGEESGVGWTHVHTGSRSFSVDKGASIGIIGRLGYVLDDGSVLYGLIGADRTSLNTTYQTASGRQFSETPVQTGFQLGGGIETPLTPRVFLRMQYAHTDYNAYGMTIPSGTDSFGAADDTVSIGLVYRFFDQSFGAKSRTAVPASRLDGFYAGAQVGYGGISSWNQGPREGGTTLTADRGGSGPGGGIFGGYGRTFGRLYLGAEIDGGGNGESWVNRRGPDGRDYGVNKIANLGLSARAGYVLASGALIYGRLGPSLGFYDTRNDTSTSTVTQESAVLGLGIGFGMEVPVNKHVFLRADYGYDLYNSKYTISTTEGGEQFRSNDSQFSVGILYRF